MGTSSTRYDRSREAGFQIDPTHSPIYFHSIENGTETPSTGSARAHISSAMEAVKICKTEAEQLQEKLQNEYFTRWNETCDVQDFNGIASSELDSLLHKISERFTINGKNIYAKISGIRFAKEIDVNIFEFTFGEELSSGTIHFGMIAISKESASLEAVSCLYTLDFAVARVRVEKKRKKRILGINAGTDRRSWLEPKSLGFVTQRALINFCRMKALTEFQRRGIITNINDVPSIEDA
ncbi:hypothetical protein MAR_030482 [Mya arenaria]|uniref:Uncharacterized protein n=1 Tax=Mya arenaria TaxID=6604 RepID=A0ABY7F125_MYAAR|nr:uncharacterized protein LOC128206377 [Mya arenaria]WAR15888.1 hypothetical protein MAR_030482 [Mya arenaria]